MKWEGHWWPRPPGGGSRSLTPPTVSGSCEGQGLLTSVWTRLVPNPPRLGTKCPFSGAQCRTPGDEGGSQGSKVPLFPLGALSSPESPAGVQMPRGHGPAGTVGHTCGSEVEEGCHTQ